MTGLFETTDGPWQIDRMGDIVSGSLNVCIPYATRKEDKRAIAQIPALLALVRSVYTDSSDAVLAEMARKIVAELEDKL